jgi:tripartite-type tricarboxylate transporter receptor subunit TctC
LTITRRFALVVAALLPIGAVAAAQDYPNRPVRFIVSFAAGGPNDVIGRLLGKYLSERLGQQFFVDNRVGAGGNIGTQAALSSPPDGYTILSCGSYNFISATLYESLPFDFIRDSVPVGGMMRMSNVLVVNNDVPIRTLQDYVAYAKANPYKLNFGHTGTGASPHMSGELLKSMTGINIVPVPYRGSAPAQTDLLGGRLQSMFDNLPGMIGHIKEGRVRALGLTAPKRIAALPDVPAIAEVVPGFQSESLYGVCASKGTPPEIINKLNGALNSVLNEPAVVARIAELGAEPMPMTPAEWGKVVLDETEKWAIVVKDTGLKIH